MNAGRPVAALLWIAFTVLVAGALWIVLGACGLALPGGRPMLVFCPVDVAARQVDPALAAEQDRQEALEGCWQQASDLTMQIRETGELITVRSWEVCFADDGQGRQTMVLTSGAQCHGRVVAGFPDAGTLQIDDTDDMRCDNGSYNVASTTTCKLAGDGTAQCVRSDQDNPQHASTVTMRRTGR